MNGLLLLIVGLIYIVIGINYCLGSNTGLGITFFAYALANYGLWVAGGS